LELEVHILSRVISWSRALLLILLSTSLIVWTCRTG